LVKKPSTSTSTIYSYSSKNIPFHCPLFLRGQLCIVGVKDIWPLSSMSLLGGFLTFPTLKIVKKLWKSKTRCITKINKMLDLKWRSLTSWEPKNKIKFENWGSMSFNTLIGIIQGQASVAQVKTIHFNVNSRHPTPSSLLHSYCGTTKELKSSNHIKKTSQNHAPYDFTPPCHCQMYKKEWKIIHTIPNLSIII